MIKKGFRNEALFLFMLKSEEELNIFFEGIDYFNSHRYEEAHKLWEILWKQIGNTPRRLGLKVFLQLSAIYQNEKLQKLDSIRYSINTALKLFNANKSLIAEVVKVTSIENFLTLYEDKNISLKKLDELIIKRNEVVFIKPRN